MIRVLPLFALFSVPTFDPELFLKFLGHVAPLADWAFMKHTQEE